MEIKNSLNRLDPYLNRVDLDSEVQKADTGAASGARLHTGSLAREGDKVSLSSTALRDVVAKEAMRAPDVRQEKVDAIKASLASGEYGIDSRDIASKLLGF